MDEWDVIDEGYDMRVELMQRENEKREISRQTNQCRDHREKVLGNSLLLTCFEWGVIETAQAAEGGEGGGILSANLRYWTLCTTPLARFPPRKRKRELKKKRRRRRRFESMG